MTEKIRTEIIPSEFNVETLLTTTCRETNLDDCLFNEKRGL